MQILGKTKIDFLGKQPITFTLSAILLALAIWSLSGGINRGIDFAGGTEIQVLFAEPVAIDDLRDGLSDRGIDASLQRIGVDGANEYLIRVGAEDSSGTAHAAERPAPVTLAAAPEPQESTDEPAGSQTQAPAEVPGTEAEVTDEPASSPADDAVMPPAETPEAGGESPTPAVEPVSTAVPTAPTDVGVQSERVYSSVLAALREITGVADRSGLDLNVANEQEIATALQAAALGVDEARQAAAAAIAFRTANSLFRSFDEVASLPGMTPEAVRALESGSYLGPFTIRKVDFVGPRVGKELAEKAYLAMVFALAGMLVYITLRFRNLGYALGGIVALIHDGIISAGVFNLWGGQFDLTIVAGLLTLLGYSINDTIVVFDRVRENMATMKGTGTRQVFNNSINQTLSRTLLTSVTTLLVVLCLYSFGGDTIHGFAFLLLFGILIGTYSTIFIASPVAIFYQSWSARRKPASKSRGEKPSSRGRAAS